MSLAAGYAMKKRNAKCMAHGAEACGECMAGGGFVSQEKASGYSAGTGEDGIVDRIMQRFAKGGEATMGRDVVPDADGESADFDYLDQMSEDMDADETGENSGDEDGDKRLDDDEDDVVKRAHASWKKKDKNPRPA